MWDQMNKHENPNTGRPWEPNVKDTINSIKFLE